MNLDPPPPAGTGILAWPGPGVRVAASLPPSASSPGTHPHPPWEKHLLRGRDWLRPRPQPPHGGLRERTRPPGGAWRPLARAQPCGSFTGQPGTGTEARAAAVGGRGGGVCEAPGTDANRCWELQKCGSDRAGFYQPTSSRSFGVGPWESAPSSTQNAPSGPGAAPPQTQCPLGACSPRPVPTRLCFSALWVPSTQTPLTQRGCRRQKQGNK